MADDAMRFLVRSASGTDALPAGLALTAALPAANVTMAGPEAARTPWDLDADLDTNLSQPLTAILDAFRGGLGNSFNAGIYGYRAGTKKDQTPAILRTIAAAKRAGGGTCLFPPGQAWVYNIADVTGADGVRLQGSGGATEWMSRHASRPILQATGGINTRLTGFTVRDIKFTCGVTRTADPLLDFDTSMYSCGFFDCGATDWGSLLRVTGFVFVYWWRGSFQQMVNPPPASYGAMVGSNGNNGNSGAGFSIIGVLLRGNSAGPDPSQWTTGLIMKNVEALSTKQFDVGGFDRGVFSAPDWASRNHFWEDTYFDATWYGPSFELGGSGPCQRWSFSNCWWATSGGLATPFANAPLFRVSSSGVCEDFIFGVSRFFSGGGPGMQIDGQFGFQAQINGCLFQDNGACKTTKDANGTTVLYPQIVSSAVGSPQPTITGTTFKRTAGDYAVVYPPGSTGISAGDNPSDKPFYFGAAPVPTLGGPIAITKSRGGDHVWDIDCSDAPTPPIPASGLYGLASGSGFLILTNLSNGSTGTYAIGGAGVFLFGSSTGSGWGVGETAGVVNVKFAAGGYYIDNRTASPVSFGIAGIKTRASV